MKTISLKPLDQQVVVITGASSGIGLATARAAARAGARVMLAARNEAALRSIVEPLEADGHSVAFMAIDVADPDAVKRLAGETISRFGRIDTWVNVAGVDIWGKITEVPVEDARHLFETNFWGVVNGALAALPLLRRQGGALITVGSIAGDRAFPLQGFYCASKHAVKGFIDALRMEVQSEDWPVSVTLIKPASVGTPLQRQAKNFMAEEPKLPTPLYSPESVAEAILHAARVPTRDLNVGFIGLAMTTLGTLMPAFSDFLGRAALIQAQRRGRPAEHRQDNLHSPGRFGGAVRDARERRTIRPSLFAIFQRQPVPVRALVELGGVAALALLMRPRRRF